MRPDAAILPEATSRAPVPQGAPALLRTLRIIHPFPTLLNVAATAGLAFVAAGGAPSPGLLVRMLLVMLCAQAAIGVTNDYFDRDLDARTKPWKPLAAGLLAPSAAIALALALIVTMIAMAATLGAGGWALAVAGMSCGLAYDVRLKRTPFSAVPYMFAMPLLPLWVWLTLGEWHAVLWWLLPVGALIGLALHLANTLPDIEDDTAQGVLGLAHRLGKRRSMFVAWGSFALALAWALALEPFVDYEMAAFVPAFLVAWACLDAAILLYARRRDATSLTAGFGLLGIGAAVLAVGWLAAVT